MYFVYIIRCQDNSLYTGITTDIKRRFNEHCGLTKGAKYTKTHKPIQIEFVKRVENRAEASKLEYKFKHLEKSQKEELILSHENEIKNVIL